ncbi:hypothetical protein PVK62_04540 [Aliivibrio sp. S3MY1]|uniref:hypothetical protein n=1 Tax=unclassified Aliivibrio TaxID=2645654 RepID=UPI0023787975|nr:MULTISPECIES: hypothetical protein [unclassified Aliivibrio]MDD9195104.1 hypothetical protein [Aliivibrio sp. S3MY1]MDD9198394.1 hypothetical protein [Aliivibrio sp. S2MY1]
MAREVSQDITVLFSAFDIKERSYNELCEVERYNKVKKSWNALDLLSKSKESENNAPDLHCEHFINKKEPE